MFQSHGKDPFGCDPFAILHAPTRDSVTGPPPRPESPSPALPPKKSKQPPPRPAPPRPMLPPTPSPTPAASDPFGAPSNDPFAGSDGFADFSNFNSKVSSRNLTSTVSLPKFWTALARSLCLSNYKCYFLSKKLFLLVYYSLPLIAIDPFGSQIRKAYKCISALLYSLPLWFPLFCEY